MKMCHFGISDQAFCLFSLVQVYCCEYNKKFWNSQPKIAIFWKYKNMLMSAHILGIFFLKWLLNLCYPLQKTVVPQNILILPPNIENKWKKSFLEQSKLCPCWGTVPPPVHKLPGCIRCSLFHLKTFCQQMTRISTPGWLPLIWQLETMTSLASFQKANPPVRNIEREREEGGRKKVILDWGFVIDLSSDPKGEIAVSDSIETPRAVFSTVAFTLKDVSIEWGNSFSFIIKSHLCSKHWYEWRYFCYIIGVDWGFIKESKSKVCLRLVWLGLKVWLPVSKSSGLPTSRQSWGRQYKVLPKINTRPRAQTLIKLRTLSKCRARNTLLCYLVCYFFLSWLNLWRNTTFLLLGIHFLHFPFPRTYIHSVKGVFTYSFFWQRLELWWSIFMNVKRLAVWWGG